MAAYRADWSDAMCMLAHRAPNVRDDLGYLFRARRSLPAALFAYITPRAEKCVCEVGCICEDALLWRGYSALVESGCTRPYFQIARRKTRSCEKKLVAPRFAFLVCSRHEAGSHEMSGGYMRDLKSMADRSRRNTSKVC